ncbi:MAG: hypothetical protein V1875_07660 [Candidatus Altiarchaeota archaeon]
MKGLIALVLASLVLGCVTSYNSELSVGVNGSASFNKSFGTQTTQLKKAVTTTLAETVPTTTVTAEILPTTTTTPAGEVLAATGIGLTFTPDKETVALSEKFWEDLMFTNLDSAKNYSVVIHTYSPGGWGDGGQDVNIAFADSFARENGITTFGFGMPITPFTHKEDGYASEMEYFTRKGEHHYDISVYDCTLIEQTTGAENCGRGKRLIGEYENPDVWNGQQAVFHLDKVITVT